MFFQIIGGYNIDSQQVNAIIETFEFLPKPSKSSFPRKQESSPFKVLWIPAFAGMTKEGRFSKVSYWVLCPPNYPYTIHSERFYVNWIVRFIRFRHMRSRDAFRLNSK